RNVRSTGLIAMKLDDGDRLIGVATCREGDDVFLATRQARCIRFQITDDTLRVFAGRDSSGVRGIRLGAGDEVISLSVLRHVEASVDERAAYLKYAAAQRRAGGEEGEAEIVESDEAAADIQLTSERIAALQLAEEMILTVTTGGFGKLSSAYEYRVTGRGGQGIANIALAARNGRAVAASFPVRPGDDIMLVTDQGKLIRAPVDQVRITGRQAMGVTLVRVEKDEQVTSVFPVLDDGGDEAGEEQDG
ncbi:DNA gyrase C-terminal beta-propeller domain-containing protein, partial [Acidiphilium sp.]|uniref:DNA gyrase C-terminal beta-propeller domain-containing protein n=1 Tax=Acidiphilium sp. TaxID=527 RepID=UPI00258F5DA6